LLKKKRFRIFEKEATDGRKKGNALHRSRLNGWATARFTSPDSFPNSSKTSSSN
jgi:hypothetical protein